MRRKHIGRKIGCLAFLAVAVTATPIYAQQGSYTDRFGNTPGEQQVPDSYPGGGQSPSDTSPSQMDYPDTSTGRYQDSRGAQGPVRSDMTAYSTAGAGGMGYEGFLRWQLQNSNSP